MSIMLYKSDGSQKIHGGMFDTLIVEQDGLEDALNDGWFKSTSEALDVDPVEEQAKHDAESEAKPTREEMETKAKELDISFSPNIGDDNLLARIQQALKDK